MSPAADAPTACSCGRQLCPGAAPAAATFARAEAIAAVSELPNAYQPDRED